jgi:hypothetical protein
MITAFMYHASGEPKMARQYSAPGRFHIAQDTVRLEAAKEGERVTIVGPYGVERVYRVDAVDGSTALITLEGV